MKNIITLLICLLLISGILFSQSLSTSGKSYLREAVREKLKINLDDLREYINTGQQKIKAKSQHWKKTDRISAIDEVVISDDPQPESEIHAAMNPKDTANIVVSAMRQDPTNLTEALTCPIYYTEDFGKTWRKSGFKNLPTDEGALVVGGGDPMFAFDRNGKLYFSWINIYTVFDPELPIYGALFWVYSTNGGKVWQREQNDIIGSSNGNFDLSSPTLGLPGLYDKQWMAVDKSGSSFQDNLYTVLAYISIEGTKEKSDMRVFRKSKDSSTFDQGYETVISTGDYDLTQFASVDIDDAGRIHATFTAVKDGNMSFYHTMSEDGGKTFSKEVKITDFKLNGSPQLPGDPADSVTGITKARTYPAPQVVVDKSGKHNPGLIYFTFTADGIDDVSSTGKDIYFCKSLDNGATWSNPVRVNNDDPSKKRTQYYSSINVNSQGVIVISWYDRRDDPGDLNTHYYLAFSFDNGDTFINQTNVSKKATDFSTIGAQNAGFGIGEYNQILCTDYYAIPIWADGSFNDGDVNIHAAFVPISKEPLSVEPEKIVTISDKFNLDEVFPNPSKNEFSISCSFNQLTNVKLSVKDIQAKEVLFDNKGNFGQGNYQFKLNASGLAPGIYYVVLSTQFGSSARKVIIVK